MFAAGKAIGAELDAEALSELQAAGGAGGRLVAGALRKLGEASPGVPAQPLKINDNSLQVLRGGMVGLKK